MLNKDDEAKISGLLAAALHKPPAPLNEKLTTIETFRKWGWIAFVGITMGVIGAEQIRFNTSFVREWGPKVKAMWWMKENGYTNKDVEPIGPIKLPKFD